MKGKELMKKALKEISEDREKKHLALIKANILEIEQAEIILNDLISYQNILLKTDSKDLDDELEY